MNSKKEPRVKTVGDLIRRYRELQRLSQQALATRAGLSVTSVSLIECGKRSPAFTTVHRLAVALNVSLDQLTPPTSAAA